MPPASKAIQVTFKAMNTTIAPLKRMRSKRCARSAAIERWRDTVPSTGRYEKACSASCVSKVG